MHFLYNLLTLKVSLYFHCHLDGNFVRYDFSGRLGTVLNSGTHATTVRNRPINL